MTHKSFFNLIKAHQSKFILFIKMSDSNLNFKLDKDFLYILDFSKNLLNNFSKDPTQNSLCNQWLTKLNSVSYEGMTAKRTRNSYLTKLIICMYDGKLSGMFLKKPPAGDLESIPMPFIIESEPYWLNDAIGSDENDGAKDCQTYMSTQMLDNNCGICAYFGMNIVDEGDEEYNWLNIGDGSKFDKKIDDIFENDVMLNFENLIRIESMKKVTEENAFVEHRKFLIKLILKELEGKAKQKNPDLEEVLLVYLKQIRGTEEEQAYKNLSSERKRNFLLSNLKSCLINELIKFAK